MIALMPRPARVSEELAMKVIRAVAPVAVAALLVLAPASAHVVYAQRGGGGGAHGGGGHGGGGGGGAAHAAPRAVYGGAHVATGPYHGGVYHGGGYYHGGYYPYYRGYYPYYSFYPHVSIGFGIWAGYPVGYPYSYGYYPYAYPYAYPYPYGYYGYPYPPAQAPPPNYQYQAPPPQNPQPTPQGYNSASVTASGGLSFEITPETAEVYVDGGYVGTTGQFSPTSQPLTLSPGHHRVELRAMNYQSMTFDADVPAGQVIPYKGTLQPR
jgi:hypothetical protein